MNDFLNIKMARQDAFNGIADRFQFTIERSSTEEYIMARPVPAAYSTPVSADRYTGKLKFKARIMEDGQPPVMAMFQEYLDLWGQREWHEVEVEYE